ncbi:MAG: carboxypeptidase-like regulatory domain-containing protein [Bacteroidota bacterium]
MDIAANKLKYTLSGLVVVFLSLLMALPAAGQTQDDEDYTRVHGRLVIQVSGVVLEAGTQVPLMGVHVYSPRYGRGTTTNVNGFFSDVFLEGDSILVSAVGFQRQWIVLTAEEGDKLTLVIEMEEDTTYLSEVEVLPYPTERQLRESILAMSDPNVQQQLALARSMTPERMALLIAQTPMDASSNYRNYFDQQFYNQYNSGVRGIPLLNPFAWNELIKSIKRGDFKKN